MCTDARYYHSGSAADLPKEGYIKLDTDKLAEEEIEDMDEDYPEIDDIIGNFEDYPRW